MCSTEHPARSLCQVFPCCISCTGSRVNCNSTMWSEVRVCCVPAWIAARQTQKGIAKVLRTLFSVLSSPALQDVSWSVRPSIWLRSEDWQAFGNCFSQHFEFPITIFTLKIEFMRMTRTVSRPSTTAHVTALGVCMQSPPTPCYPSSAWHEPQAMSLRLPSLTQSSMCTLAQPIGYSATPNTRPICALSFLAQHTQSAVDVGAKPQPPQSAGSTLGTQGTAHTTSKPQTLHPFILFHTALRAQTSNIATARRHSRGDICADQLPIDVRRATRSG